MRFLADESCDVVLGRSLVQAGHDVLEVREARPGADDEYVVALAVSEIRKRFIRTLKTLLTCKRC